MKQIGEVYSTIEGNQCYREKKNKQGMGALEVLMVPGGMSIHILTPISSGFCRTSLYPPYSLLPFSLQNITQVSSVLEISKQIKTSFNPAHSSYYCIYLSIYFILFLRKTAVFAAGSTFSFSPPVHSSNYPV